MAMHKRASWGNRIGMMVIATVVAVLILVLLVRSHSLKQKIAYYHSANVTLEEQIQAQKERSTELDALPSYIESDEYIEKVAREKFGLIYPDETIIKPEG